MVRAQREARDMGHGAVQVVHLLLGLFSDGDDIVDRVWADFGLTIEPVRELVRERLGVGPGSAPEGQLPFSPTAKDALRSAHRFGMGEPGTEHMLIVLTARGEGGVSEILRGLGADPNRIRFETKRRAWPSSVPGQGSRGQLRATIREGLLDELDLGTEQIRGEVRCWFVADTGPVAALPLSLPARPEPQP
jgi:ATP-dependent Clp protease ATP-binding subunit ClpA